MSLRDLAAKATPGPWGRAHTSNLPGDGPIVKNYEDFDWVATVQVSNTPQWRENATLIALAPELAVLCADMADALGGGPKCPKHGIPDCSPLLNGCSIPNEIATLLARFRELEARP